jgi:hypothetical protein
MIMTASQSTPIYPTNTGISIHSIHPFGIASSIRSESIQSFSQYTPARRQKMGRFSEKSDPYLVAVDILGKAAKRREGEAADSLVALQAADDEGDEAGGAGLVLVGDAPGAQGLEIFEREQPLVLRVRREEQPRVIELSRLVPRGPLFDRLPDG